VLLGFKNQISALTLDAHGVEDFWEGSTCWKANVDNWADDLGNGSFLGHGNEVNARINFGQKYKRLA
jgi:hypothetical protein